MLDRTTIFCICLIILLLLNPLIKLLRGIWEFMVKLCKTKQINLQKEFGDWAVVTGSTDGVGKEYAKELARRNINVILISRNLDKLNNTKDEIQAINSSIQIRIIQADFSKGKSEIEKIQSQLNDIPVGILVNNVGTLTECPMYLDEIPEDELWDMINVNIGATTLMTRIIIQQMKRRGRGAIVNVSSASDLVPLPLMSVYSASKAFVKHFSEGIRVEYAKYGLTIQCLSPFYIRTKMIGYSRQLTNNWMIPDAETYAKNAIDTLGKLDSTTGYWLFDIPYFITIITPSWLGARIGLFINHSGRNEHFYAAKEERS